MQSRTRPAEAALVLLLFATLAVVWTWPLAARLSSRVPNDPGDPVLNTWILWWNTQQIPLTTAWWNAPFFDPLPGALALSEHLLGLAVVTTPLQFAGASPLAAYNVSLLLSYALSGFFAYLLAWRLTGSRLAAACGGMAFAFAPYRAGQLAHIQVLTSQWMPAMLLGAHGYLETGRRRWLALFGGAWLLQALSNGYYLLFVPVLLTVWIAWFAEWRRAPRRSLVLVASWVAASLLLLPILLQYHRVHGELGLGRNLADIRQFSASLESLTFAPPLLALWPAGDAASTAEDWLFPGATVPVLTVAGILSLLVRREWRTAISSRSPLLFYTAAAGLMFWLTLGPGGEAGRPPSLVRPYAWLMWLPGYDGLRVPSRFAMLGALCLAMSASLAVAALVRRRARWRTAIACLALAGIAADGLMEEVPLVVPPQRIAPELVPRAAVIEIPTDDALLSVAAMYRAIFHRQPVANGYSGYLPPHYGVLSLALWRGDVSVLRYFARSRPLAILVNHELDTDGGFRRMVGEIQGVGERGATAAGTLFLLPQEPPAPPFVGETLPALTRDGGAKRVVADLGRPRTITGVQFALRDRYRDLAGRVLIETSTDGEGWTQAWLGWTGEFALDAMLQNPRVARVRIPIAETMGRFVRFYPAEPWMVDELTVLGK